MENRFNFRIWNKQKQEYETNCYGAIWLNGLYRRDEYTIEQYVGLRDNRNEPIFEHDIVKILFEDDECAIIRYDYETARYVIDNIWDKVEYDFDNFYSNELEVIGNIHQDLEILKEK